jgi:hypothetical protein
MADIEAIWIARIFGAVENYAKRVSSCKVD